MNSFETRPPRTSIHWLSVVQFTLSLLGALGMWGIALTFAFIGLSQLFDPGLLQEEVTSVLLLAAGTGLAGSLLVPSAVYSLLNIIGRPSKIFPPGLARLWHPNLLIFFVPIVIFLGDQVSRSTNIAWLALPPLHILAVGIPVLWLTYLGRRKLFGGTPQREWGIFASGLVIGPALVLVVEMVAIVVIGLLGIVFIASQPDLVAEMNRLVETLNNTLSPEEVMALVEPYLMQPVVIYAILAFVAGIVPLVEEAIKPVGVWLFAWRILTPAEGFVAGLISGAGFALFENLALSTLGGQWTAAVILRMGTGLLHIMTAGLSGWALALAWKEGRYVRLFLAYLAAVIIHSLWNGLAIVASAGDLELDLPVRMLEVSQWAGIGLIMITVMMAAVMIASNLALRRENIAAQGSANGLDQLPG